MFLAAMTDCGYLPTATEGGCLLKVRKDAELALDELIETVFDRIGAIQGKDNNIVSIEDWKREFIRANNAWRHFRDTTCNLYWYEGIPGSGTGNFVEQCKLRMTIDRIRLVDNYKR